MSFKKHSNSSFNAMGGEFNVIVVSEDFAILALAEDFIARLEKLWSRFDSRSEISLLNAAEGKPVAISKETHDLIALMRSGFRSTQGAYDPTVLPRVIAAGYDRSLTNPELKTVLPESAQWPGDVEGIELHGAIACLPLGTTLDSGGIGKGFAADLLVSKMMELGAHGALVSASGDVVAAGESPQGGGWTIGIENPFDLSQHIEIVTLKKGAIATSSTLKRIFENNKHHLISTNTKDTFNNEIATVSVLAGNGALAEVLTKVAFSLELDEAMTQIESLGGSALVVMKSGAIVRSPQWELSVVS